VLSAADLMGHYPKRLVLIGCQPLDLENWGGALTPPVAKMLEPAIQTANQFLTDWGVAVTRRPRLLDSDAGLLGNAIDQHAYERRVDVN
jgi:hydrogenase maturation protease